jgi:methylmalonyl-CoA mutase N-terminal domain/subunit
MAQVEDLGGATAAIEDGFQKSEIERSAYLNALQIASGERVVVGVNAYTTEDEEHHEAQRVDPLVEAGQIERVKLRHDSRDARAVRDALAAVADAAAGSANVLYPLKRALAAGATVGETCDVLRQEWGTYEAQSFA